MTGQYGNPGGGGYPPPGQPPAYGYPPPPPDGYGYPPAQPPAYGDPSGGYGAPPAQYGGADDALDAYLGGDDESGGLGAIPAGPYRARVTSVENYNTGSGGYAWKLELEISDGGPFNGRKLFYYMNFLNGQGQLSGGIGFSQMALKALGLPYVGANGQPAQMKFRKSDVLGKEVSAKVEIQQGGEYAGRNQTASLEPLNQPGAGVAGPGGFPAPAGYPPMTPAAGYPPPSAQPPYQPPAPAYPPAPVAGGYPPAPAGYPPQQPPAPAYAEAPPAPAWPSAGGGAPPPAPAWPTPPPGPARPAGGLDF